MKLRPTQYRSVPLLAMLFIAPAAWSQQSPHHYDVPQTTAPSHSSIMELIAAPGDENWNKGIEPFVVNGPVYTVEEAPNGDLYIGGMFSMVNGVQTGNLARWNGTTWSSVGNGVSGSVFALAFKGNDVIVGGSFPSAGSEKASNIARWDGTRWHAFGDIAKEGLTNQVNAMAWVGDTLYVAGEFDYSGNQDVMNYIARWSPEDSLFLSLDDGTRRGMDEPVVALAAHGNDLYVAGEFTKAGGTNTSRIAKWNGTAWSNLGAGVGVQGTSTSIRPGVGALLVRDSILYVGGYFTFAGGKPIRHLAQWNINTSTWSAVGSGIDSAVTDITMNDSGHIYIAGLFTKAGGNTVNGVAKWGGTSAGWSALGSGVTGFATRAESIGKDLYVGGFFTTAGGKPSANLARWSEPEGGQVGAAPRAGRDEAIGIRTFPNPARDLVRLDLRLPAAEAGTVEIVNIHGEKVAMLPVEPSADGAATVSWRPDGIPNGTYILRLSSGGRVSAAAVVLAR